ncbi:hypothetical protein StoSoilB5_26700 [Arthrobacter sp. StoSoilB5]|nr:hypothetical protein StoSoilB5_26700 [Arthrobacter sp. StoSoilB5]
MHIGDKHRVSTRRSLHRRLSLQRNAYRLQRLERELGGTDAQIQGHRYGGRIELLHISARAGPTFQYAQAFKDTQPVTQRGSTDGKLLGEFSFRRQFIARLEALNNVRERSNERVFLSKCVKRIFRRLQGRFYQL